MTDRVRRVCVAVCVALAGCGSTTQRALVNVPSVTLGTQTFAVDQLADSPHDDSGARFLYVVIRVSTTAGQHTLHNAWFTLVDAHGKRSRPVPPSVYVPIDHLDGLMIAPGHAGAGVVAFPLPSSAPRTIVVNDGTAEGSVDAP